MRARKWSGQSEVRQYRDDKQLSQLEHHGSDLSAKVGQVVFVTLADLLDEFVDAQPLEETADLA
jgi:hypothetical protein